MRHEDKQRINDVQWNTPAKPSHSLLFIPASPPPFPKPLSIPYRQVAPHITSAKCTHMWRRWRVSRRDQIPRRWSTCDHEWFEVGRINDSSTVRGVLSRSISCTHEDTISIDLRAFMSWSGVVESCLVGKRSVHRGERGGRVDWMM